MAVEYSSGLIVKTAAEDLTGKKYYGVKLNDDGEIAIAGAGEAIGVVIEECAKGIGTTIKYLGETKMAASEPVKAGDYIDTDADGRGKSVTSGKALAIALSSAGASDEYFSVAIIHGYV